MNYTLSINYELALELKNAGFPQHFEGAPQDIVMKHEGVEFDPFDKKTFWYLTVPTLEELIKACGDRELYLSKKLSDIDHQYEWRAVVPHQEPCGYGVTPTEAVAMLYLALYGKKQSNTEGGTAPRMEGK